MPAKKNSDAVVTNDAKSNGSGKKLRIDSHPHTDLGNAERFEEMCAKNALYTPGLGWHEWNGKRWEPKEDKQLLKLASTVVRAMHATGQAMEEEGKKVHDDDLKERGAGVQKHARDSESVHALRNMLTLAQSRPKLVAELDALDASPWLLNCANGTVDLRTGEFFSPRPGDRITKWTNVVYNPEARSTEWDDLLAHIGQGYDGLTEYLRRAMGHSATGDVSMDIAILLDGPGGTSKTSFLEACGASLGDYATAAPFDMFVLRRGDAAHPTDLARLRGRRMVYSEEGAKNKTLDTAKVKNLIGGSSVTARFMRGDFFEFNPVLDLWWASNFRPRVHAEDSGAWRRLRAAPFTNKVLAEQKGLREFLKTDPGVQQAVLAWIVSGARDWCADRSFHEPECVTERTAEWRRDTDSVGGWIEDECELVEDAFTPSSVLQRSINEWWKLYITEKGEPPSLAGGLGEELRTRGCRAVLKRWGPEQKATRGWVGIRLTRLVPEDPAADADVMALFEQSLTEGALHVEV